VDSLPLRSERRIFCGDFVRLLFDGARTQEEPGELEKGNRVAPFLIHDAAALTDVFVQMSSAAMWVRDIAFWLYRSQFREDLPHEWIQYFERSPRRTSFG